MSNYSLMVLALGALIVSGCGTKNTGSSSPTVSESEIAAGVVGGSVNTSSSSGGEALLQKKSTNLFANIKSSFTFIDKALASTTCPTLWNSSSSCSISGSTETLTYNNCSFTGFSNVWSGSQAIVFGGATPVCTGLPVFANGNTLNRTWAAGTTVTLGNGIIVTVDAPGSGTSGYSSTITDSGVSVLFSGAVARSITIGGIHLTGYYSGIKLLDHSINSSAISVSGTNTIAAGTVTVQHNILKYTATSTLSNIGFTAGCCYPTSGSITTTYSNGKSAETLAFNSTCGSATLNGTSYTLNYCF